jgi:hypothetical protein
MRRAQVLPKRSRGCLLEQMVDLLGISHDPFQPIPSTPIDSASVNAGAWVQNHPCRMLKPLSVAAPAEILYTHAMSKDQLMYILDLLCKTADLNPEGAHEHSGSIAIGLLAGSVDDTSPRLLPARSPGSGASSGSLKAMSSMR